MRRNSETLFMQQHHRAALAAGLIMGLLSASGCGPAATDPGAGTDSEQTPPDSAADDASAALGSWSPAVAKNYIVVLDPGATMSATTAEIVAQGISISKVFSIIPSFVAPLSESQVAALELRPDVLYIEPDQKVTTSAIQREPRFGLDRMDQRTGTNGRYNDFGFDGTGTHIYIVDTGIRTTHAEFTGRTGPGFSALGGSADEDCHGHGTHVASSAAGTVYGAAKAATVHPVRVLDCDGNGTVSGVIAGLDWLAEHATLPAVANMSLSGGASQALDDAVDRLVQTGVTVVVAAGNWDYDACAFSPARAPGAITVAATDAADRRADFSNHGACVDSFAHGVDVIGASHLSDTDTTTMSGTSMAAPHVAGVAAMYLDRYPTLGTKGVTEGLLGKATRGAVLDPAGSPNRLLYSNLGAPDPDSCYGHCEIRAPSGCFCDEFCGLFNDCCGDYQEVCR